MVRLIGVGVEFAVGNIIRRVLHLIREEYKANTAGVAAPARHTNLSVTSFESFDSSTLSQSSRLLNESNMFNMLADPAAAEDLVDYSRPCFQLKNSVITGIHEIIDELETLSSNLANQSLEHIHSDEIIMTIGRSKSVEQFLLEVGKRRKFQVMVAEAAPAYGGHELGRNLATAGIDTLVVSDAAVFALMARVNKVIIGCHAGTHSCGRSPADGWL